MGTTHNGGSALLSSALKYTEHRELPAETGLTLERGGDY